MREILRVARDRDAEAAVWFEVIDLFDRASAGGASVEELARAGAHVTARTVGLHDIWTDHTLQIAGEQVQHGDDARSTVPRAAIAQRLRGRHAAACTLANGSALAASIEIGSGRIGAAWLLGEADEVWRPLDYLVVERLAAALAAHALEASRSATDALAVERLLGGGLSELELVEASRSAGLTPNHEYVVVALEQTPPNAICLEALGAVVQRTLAAADVPAVSAVVGRVGVVLAGAQAALEPALGELAGQEDQLGIAIGAGISDPAPLEALAEAWKQAQEALALRGMTGPGARVGSFSGLGELHLLAQIPRDEILASPALQRVTETIGQHGSPSDLDVLETYLDEGTLRRAAARVFLHHTSVEHRIKRLEEELELDLSNPAVRFDTQLAIKLYRILQAQDAARTLL